MESRHRSGAIRWRAPRVASSPIVILAFALGCAADAETSGDCAPGEPCDPTPGTGGQVAAGGTAGAPDGTGARSAGGGVIGGSGGAIATGGGASSGGRVLGGTGGFNATGGLTATGGFDGTGGVTSSAGGVANAGGSGGESTAQLCRPEFASGVNVAWFDFARDVPNPPIERFNQLFGNIYPVGGRIVRWWFHTDGSVTPGYDGSGLTAPAPQGHIDGVRRILDAAAAAGTAMVISIWSFDMLQDYVPASVRQNNRRLLEDDAARQAYIDRYLAPLVSAVAGHPGLYAWEIFNEPEGMSTDHGWTPDRISMQTIQRNVNWMADAIHAADPDALVTSSAWTFITSSNVSGYSNYYSDAALVQAGGRAGGTLDFYEVHYYDNWGAQGNAGVSPFAHSASYWNLDKPIQIGEFWVLDVLYSGDYRANDMYTSLYQNGYSGAWAWQYANIDSSSAEGYSQNGQVDARWPAMQTAMQNLLNVARTAVECE